MKTDNFLLEIHTEELPPKTLQKLSQALMEAIESGLTEAGLAHGELQLFATPRRLAVIVKALAAKQPSRMIERRGPACCAAFKDGKPTQACEGFAKSCGTTVDKLETLKTDKGEFLFYKKSEAGKPATTLMPEIVEKAIKLLPIAKPMRWGKHQAQFARPVHSIIMMYGKKVIPSNFFGKKADKKTQGHRFHQEKVLMIESANTYEAQLEKQGFVIPNFEKRQQLILTGLLACAKEHKATVIIEEPLLNEVTALVEWPVVLLGQFPERFLELPREVLISTMQNHQKCFPLTNHQGKLLPLFMTVSNLQSLSPELVIKGNERVMIARLSDAEFFYKADRMQPLKKYRDDLKNVVFQAKLGTVYEKTERMKSLAEFIAEKIGANVDEAKRASELSKCDLMTSMVSEFPELQGVMGHYYALHDQESNEIAMALEEQYMPFNAEADLPKTQTGKILALADRIDTLVGIFGIGQSPTGDKDPFALRRAALGVIRILALFSEVSLQAVITQSINTYGNKGFENERHQLISFIYDRLKYWLLPQGYTANQFEAVKAGCSANEIPDFIERIEAVKQFAALPEAENLAAANKRVRNILVKNGLDMLEQTVDASLLKEAAEVELAKAIAHQEKLVLLNYDEKLKSLASLREPVDHFFDQVMVMAEDKAIKQNRLALLSQLRKLFLNVADISLL